MNEAHIARLAALSEMDDREFIYHYNKRHLADIGLPSVETWMHIPSLRAFHQRMHSTTTTAHAHEEEDSVRDGGHESDGDASRGGTKVRRRPAGGR